MVKSIFKILFTSILIEIAFSQQSTFTWQITPNTNISLTETFQYSTNPSSSTMILQIKVDVINPIPNTLVNVQCNLELSSPGACDTFLLFAFAQNQNNWIGNMYLSKPLNYLIRNQTKITLSARNTNSPTSFQDINIVITKGYERPPIFIGNLNTQTPERPLILNQDEIIKYQAIPGDSNFMYIINYRIIDGPYSSYFAIDQNTGRLTNARPLTYSDPIWVNGFVMITVEAASVINGIAQFGNSNTSTRADSTITLIDQNSYSPIFSLPNYTGFVSERATPNTLVDKLFISVSDNDYTPVNSRFRLYLDQYSGIFGISPDTGTKNVDARIIVLNGSGLDFDYGQRTFLLNIIAIETNSTSPKSSTAALTISLIQVNKYTPYFVPSDIYTATIPENLAKSTQIMQVQAIDKDTGIMYGNQSIRYKFIEGSTSLIKLDTFSGVISTSTCPSPGVSPCIDYEKLENRFFNLRIAAVDQMGEGTSALASVRINVTNVNDNKPNFTSNIYYGDITDGNNFLNSPLPNIQAIDADGDLVNYNIFSGNTPDNVWSINSTSAVLSVNRNISYSDTLPNNGFFVLTLNASDGMPSHITQCQVNITVKPVNRYTPQFNSTIYVTSISEATTGGAYVYTIVATDADNPLTPGGKLIYRIVSGGQDKFYINPNSGVVTVQNGANFNFIITPQYNITIIVNDLGTPSFANTTLLIVNITPFKAGPDFGTNIIRGPPQKKNNPVNLFVMTVTVSIRNTTNYRFIYSFIDPFKGFDKNGVPVQDLNSTEQKMFVIDPSSGVIRIGSPLNYERIAQWQAVIKCVDDNSPLKLYDTATFIIDILPVNEFPPTFTLPWTVTNKTYYVTLPQSMNQLKYPIGTFLATSPNSSLQITYSLANNPNAYFKLITTTSGSIYLNQILNFNTNVNPQVTLVATDNGDPSLNNYANIMFILKKENLYPPEFNPAFYNVTLMEKAPQGSQVIQVYAQDNDIAGSDYSKIIYTIKDNRFLIDPYTGIITTANSTPVGSPPSADLVILEVNAYDSPGNMSESKNSISSAIVYITIIDENDNSPIFSPPNYAITILDNIAIGSNVITLTATDADRGVNGIVKYSIQSFSEPTLSSSFAIKEDSGLVYTTSSLLGQLKTVNITIMAKDMGVPFNLANATLEITIKPSCQQLCVPSWIFPANASTVISVFETEPVNSQVMVLNARLVAPFDRSRLRYFFNNYNLVAKVMNMTSEYENFYINEVSGNMTIKTPLNYDKKNQYQLTVVALDIQVSQSQQPRFITVNVLKDPTRNPEFPNLNFCSIYYNFSINQLTSDQSIIGVIQAIPNYLDDIVTYKINEKSPNIMNLFTVNPVTGQVIFNNVTNEWEKFVELGVYKMRIQALVNTRPSLENIRTCNNTSYDASHVDIFVYYDPIKAPVYETTMPDICIDSMTDVGTEIYKFKTIRPTLFPVIYKDLSNDDIRPFNLTSAGTIITNPFMKNVSTTYRMNISSAEDYYNAPSTLLMPQIFIVNRTNLALMTIHKTLQDVQNNKDNCLSNIINIIKSDKMVKNGHVCIIDINVHFSGGVYDEQKTDVFLYVIDQNNAVIPPLIFNNLYLYEQREPTGVIGITGTEEFLPPVVYQGVAAAIGIVAALLLLCLLFFILCCCCIPFCVSVMESTGGKEPNIHRDESLGIVNRAAWVDRRLEEEQQQISLAMGGNTIDKTIALHGQYDHDMMAEQAASQNRLEARSESLAGTAVSMGDGTATPSGYVHIEAPLTMSKSDLGAYDGNEERMVRTVTTHRYDSENMPYGGTYTNENEFSSGTNGVFSTSFNQRKSTDYVDSGRVNQLYSVNEIDEEKPVTLNPGARGPSRIGATLYRPQTPNGQAYTQSVISSNVVHDGFEDYDHRGDLAFHNEVIFSDLRPDTMYLDDYDNGGISSGMGQPYRGEIRMNAMNGMGSNGYTREVNYEEAYNETRFL